MSRVFALVIVGLIASPSLAQVIYEPVTFQHGTDVKYFYGGGERITHRYAEHEINQRSYASYGVFSGSDRSRTRELFNERAFVFSDAVPLKELSRYGYTENDARNEANANAPLYFRKHELLRAAERQFDGSLVVPADVKVAGRLYVRDAANGATTGPATTRGAVIIIPKKLLEKPVKPNRQVVMAK